MTQRLTLNAVVDAAAARVVVTRDADGNVAEAAFDLAGLPRVEALLIGRPTAEVPALVERLCGICPAAHHLAGVRALESLAGTGTAPPVPPAAQAVRRLLHHGSVIAIHIVAMIAGDRDDALRLRAFAKSAMAAAGSPGHFPATAIPGGVVASVGEDLRLACLDLAAPAMDAAVRIADRALGAPRPPDAFAGADVALVAADGRPDLFGERLRAVAADGALVIADAAAADWDALVAEADPGASAPRPYLVGLGADRGGYRVGPVAQLRVGELSTPVAAELQRRWRRDGGGAAAARAIVTVHAVETVETLLRAPELFAGPLATPVGPARPGAGVGWVDGARGLLVHRYLAAPDGTLADATILTPTAQNEHWLGELLRQAVTGDQGVAGLEDAIHEADPCLPCSAAPTGMMGLVVEDLTERR